MDAVSIAMASIAIPLGFSFFIIELSKPNPDQRLVIASIATVPTGLILMISSMILVKNRERGEEARAELLARILPKN